MLRCRKTSDTTKNNRVVLLIDKQKAIRNTVYPLWLLIVVLWLVNLLSFVPEIVGHGLIGRKRITVVGRIGRNRM